jgi:iron complex outermembrane receptor protein
MTKLLGGLLALLLPACPVLGQVVLEGKVIDIQTKEPLLGVSVRVPGSTTGATTGSDGRFRLPITQPADSLTYSFIGYQSLTRAYCQAGELVRLRRRRPSLTV